MVFYRSDLLFNFILLLQKRLPKTMDADVYRACDFIRRYYQPRAARRVELVTATIRSEDNMTKIKGVKTRNVS